MTDRNTTGDADETTEPTAAATDPDTAAASPRRWWQRALSGVLEFGIIIAGALIISVLLRTFVGQMFVIPTGSMENTLVPGDRVMVSKLGGFQRGDIVVFTDPGGWLVHEKKAPNVVAQALEFIGVLPSSSEEHLIKRVMGMPGDHVKCCDAEGRVSVNDVALHEEEYLYSRDGAQVAPANVPFDVVVPADHIFVMGDHRNSSGDSRCKLTDISQQGPPGAIAFVPVRNVVGSSVAIVAPFDRWRTFTVPETFSHIPDPTEPAPGQAKIIGASPGC